MACPKAIIFDLDGCLVDSEPLSLEAIANEMREIGIVDATAEEIGGKFLGVAMPDIVAYVATRSTKNVPDGFAHRVEARLLARYQTELRQIDGAESFLNRLQKNDVAMAIATGGSLHRMETTLKIAGLAPWFQDTASSAEEVLRGKPAPDLFHLARSRTRMAAKDCIVLEDSPHGIKGAVAAGIPAIGFVGGSHLDFRRVSHAATLREAGAVEVFSHLDEVARYVFEDGFPL